MTVLADFQIRKLCETNKPMITSFIDKQVKTDGNGLIRILGLATERTYQKQMQMKRLVE